MEKEKLLSEIEQTVKKYDSVLVDFVIRGSQGSRILEIFIDDQKGVTTEKCSEISKTIGEIIDREKIITSKYRLDVSSPGVERPLKFLVQFPKHINRKLFIELKDKEEKNFEGVLLKVNNETLVFKIANKEKEINYNKIKTAKVLIGF